jgi:hypothetical protein
MKRDAVELHAMLDHEYNALGVTTPGIETLFVKNDGIVFEKQLTALQATTFVAFISISISI